MTRRLTPDTVEPRTRIQGVARGCTGCGRGISIDTMAEGLPVDFKRDFLVVRFFNPVRYIKLLEIVPGRDTDPRVTQVTADFGETVLGKGVVIAVRN